MKLIAHVTSRKKTKNKKETGGIDTSMSEYGILTHVWVNI